MNSIVQYIRNEIENRMLADLFLAFQTIAVFLVQRAHGENTAYTNSA